MSSRQRAQEVHRHHETVPWDCNWNTAEAKTVKQGAKTTHPPDGRASKQGTREFQPHAAALSEYLFRKDNKAQYSERKRPFSFQGPSGKATSRIPDEELDFNDILGQYSQASHHSSNISRNNSDGMERQSTERRASDSSTASSSRSAPIPIRRKPGIAQPHEETLASWFSDSSSEGESEGGGRWL